jgi:tRNA(adenine34) deaminase
MYMDKAIEQAKLARSHGDVPIGAVIVLDGEVIASAGNEIVLSNDPTAHAEMLVLRRTAQALGTARLVDCDLYVTLEPCPMCAQAIAFARIRRLYYGAYDPKGGGVDHGPKIFTQKTCNHKPEVYGGIQEQQCASLLLDFFNEKR